MIGLWNRWIELMNQKASILDLLIRLWIGYIFFVSGLTKMQSWQTTLFLFEYEYNVPFIPFEVAAYMGTAAELILPVLLVLGIATRLTAFALFVFNAVAVYAYQSFLFGDNGAAGLTAHLYWGFLLLVPLLYGPGKLSLDYIIGHSWLKTAPALPSKFHVVVIGLGGIIVSVAFLTNIPTVWTSLPFEVVWLEGWKMALMGYLGIAVSVIFLIYGMIKPSSQSE